MQGSTVAHRERRSRLTGRVWRFVADPETDTEGIPPGEAEAMVERATANAGARARIVLDARHRRRERRRGPEYPSSSEE
ncbi:hypothetical protein Q8791_30780 [Nocardiopsis sp. CT-R113]|uniref:Uncharacterized protein n=1 Tax=Nocardiopsis codii TaxID=3065942 RepID=A0ABU7KHA3_9ACTN|nr:hypothetical protein [Nocardiopsis sp. CT-R113]MEE2041615.1 hypothetical protein [Nocardiopsis sp. CT-R113]